MWQNAGKAGLDQWNFTLLPTSRSQARVYSMHVPNTGVLFDHVAVTSDELAGTTKQGLCED